MTVPTPGLFRDEAIRHHLQAEEGRGLVRVAPPWTWALAIASLSGLGTALVAACIGRVEVTGRARGILRPASGIRVVTARVEGTIEGIEVRSGQRVRAGQVLARIETPLVKTGLLEAVRQLASVRHHFQVTTRLQDQAYEEQSRRLDARKARLREQIASQGRSVGLAEVNLERHVHLRHEGIQSPAQVDDARQESLWQRRLTTQSAELRVESQSLLLARTVHEAPEEGGVEAMLVKPGQRVDSGQALCKIIPQTAPLCVVAFLDEKDRAFVRLGDTVALELDQLPYAEYGTVRARVDRISADLASGFEIQEALGDHPLAQVPAYRLELRLVDSRAAARAGIPLRSGMLLKARFTLRRQRFITLVLDPLRKWLR